MANIINLYISRIDRQKAAVWGFAITAWIFILEYSLYLVRPDVPDKLIKLVAFFSMLLFLRFQSNNLAENEKKLLALFSVLLLTALIPAIFNWDGIGMLQWMKFAFMFMILAFILMRVQALKGQGELLAALYLGLGVIFSLQAIIAFFAILFGWLDSSVIVDIGRRPGQQAVSLGLLGYANAIQTPITDLKILRAQGWFVEPSILSGFLLYPMFCSIAGYRQTGNVMYLIFAGSIFTAILITFSYTGFFSVVAIVLFLVLSKSFYTWMQQHKIWKYAYPFLILIIWTVLCKGILFGAHKMHEINTNAIQIASSEGRYNDRATNSEKTLIAITKMSAKNPEGTSGSLVRETYKSNTYINVLLSHPLGVGFGPTLGTNESNSPTALTFWAMSGGFPAIAVVLALFWYIFWTFCHPLLICGNLVYRYAAASFIGHAIHNMSYGNWMAPFFLLHLAIVVMSARALRNNSR